MKPKKDFSTASLAVIGVDRQEVFYIVGLAVDGKVAFRKKVRRLGFEDASLTWNPAWARNLLAECSADWATRRGSSRRFTSDPSWRAKERLQRWGGDRRGRAAAEPACGPREEPRPARSAGLSSRPVATGVTPDSKDKPDPGLSHRARDRCQVWCPRSSQLAVRHPRKPRGWDAAANGQPDPHFLWDRCQRISASRGWRDWRAQPSRAQIPALMSVPGIWADHRDRHRGRGQHGRAFERGRERAKSRSCALDQHGEPACDPVSIGIIEPIGRALVPPSTDQTCRHRLRSESAAPFPPRLAEIKLRRSSAATALWTSTVKQALKQNA